MPVPQPYDPCHLWQDAVTSGATKIEQGVLAIENGDQELGEQLIQEGVDLIEGNLPLLEQCRLDNPGSGPDPDPPDPMMAPQQKGIRQISESEIVSETEEQQTVRMAVDAIRAAMQKIKQVTRK